VVTGHQQNDTLTKFDTLDITQFPTIFVIFINAHTGLGYTLILKMTCVPSYYIRDGPFSLASPVQYMEIFSYLRLAMILIESFTEKIWEQVQVTTRIQKRILVY
jgi:hypothetical protein